MANKLHAPILQDSSDMTNTAGVSPPGGIFFGGCGWACSYSLGAAVRLRHKFQHIPHMPVGGVSAGTLVALAYILVPDVEIVSMFNWISEIARTHGTVGMMSVYMHVLLDHVLPIQGTDGTEYQQLNGGRFSVGITRFPCRPELVREWVSNRHVHDVVHASMHVPIYCTYQSTILATYGTLSRAFWDISYVGKTIYISPFVAKAHIHPQKNLLGLAIIWPPSANRRQELFKQGHCDAEAYFANSTTPIQRLRHSRGTVRSLMMWSFRNIVSLGTWGVFVICRILRWSSNVGEMGCQMKTEFQ